jgi:hypothetical protein
MKGRGYVAALFAAFAFNAHAACTEVSVDVLPFNVIEDYSKSFEALHEYGVSSAEVGLVRTTSTVKVQGCTATVGYRDPVLYIASELKRNQCAFDHVKEHELTHVRIYQEALATLKQRIEARTANGEDLFQAAKTEVLAVEALHKAFDSPEEYAENKSACNGKIIKLALNR